jgi:ATP-dependent exoDNAse (exonuclease V) beta subunit
LESKLNYFADPNFVFDEDLHSYYYLNPKTGRPIQTFRSVTNFISQFKPEFNSEMMAAVVAKKRGTTKQAVLNEWKEIADIAVNLGTRLHKWIEDYYNGTNPALPEDPILLDRVNKFLELHHSKLYKFRQIKQELRIFSRKWGIAGTLDDLLELNNQYYVGDWKSNKKFTTDEQKEGRYKKLLWPFEDMWDNSLNGYSIQLSLYRLILQEEAGFRTAGGFLVWIGPELKPEMHKIVDLRERLYEFLQKNNDNIL